MLLESKNNVVLNADMQILLASY